MSEKKPDKDPPKEVAQSIPSSMETILDRGKGGHLIVKPGKPYAWEDGKHDIPLTESNAALIGMAIVHEGGTAPKVSAAELKVLEEADKKDNATDEEHAAYEGARVKHLISESMEQYANWYIILVACQQVRDLSQSNLDNFTRMCKAKTLPSRAVMFISYWASTRDILASNVAIRERFVTNKFFEYHTTGSSSPALCSQAISEAGSLEVFSADEKKVVEDAAKTPYDLESARKIPDITLVKARAIHEAAGTLPDVWYMGQKAADRYSGKKYSAIVKLLKRYFELQSGIEKLEGMDLATVAKSLEELFKSPAAQSPPSQE
jgi:hypothetical protein